MWWRKYTSPMPLHAIKMWLRTGPMVQASRGLNRLPARRLICSRGWPSQRTVVKADNHASPGTDTLQELSAVRVEAIKHILSTLFAAQNALKTLAPEFKWAGMGNLLGDYGEFVCIEHYNLKKAPAGSNGFDAITPEGQTVQIKAMHASSQIGFRGEADLMLVIKVDARGDWEEIYFGPFAPVAAISRYSARDNKRTTTMSKLKQLQVEN